MYMDRISWKVFAILASSVIGAGALFGETGLGVGFAVACAMAIIAILIGNRRYRPEHGGVWLLTATSLSLFLAGGIVAEFTAATAGLSSTVYPGWREPFDLAAYGAALAGL